mmetsp:Transcript_3156/g.6549  ORF Transcript_3156/g.6549 Transcript_3156/m.6549 type:complete len:80 (+) Transcript_3156:3621-3860(+)
MSAIVDAKAQQANWTVPGGLAEGGIRGAREEENRRREAFIGCKFEQLHREIPACPLYRSCRLFLVCQFNSGLGRQTRIQ